MSFHAFKGALLVLLSSSCILSALDPVETPKTPKDALKILLDGNERFMKNASRHPNRSQELREALTEIQSPFAVVIACSDSRVSPVIVFDQGLGDLFEVRIAGNVVGPVAAASTEYSVKILGSSLIFVLGHENCGAVDAVLKGKGSLIEPIAVKIQAALKGAPKLSDNPLENAIKANVRHTVKQLREAPVFAQLIKDKKLEIVGGYYHLGSGKVELCCDPQ